MTWIAAATLVGSGVASGTEARETGTELAEIVVTANRRAQPLQDVGASVDSLAGGSLPERGVRTTADLQKLVPGFTAAESGVNFPFYSMRGVGLNDPSLGANSTIAISVDEVPLPYAAMTQGELLDIARIEVVKGPQGTLYGQNATGGAINYIANGPEGRATAGARLGLGRFDTVNGEFHAGGPLAETLAARLAMGATRAGTWQRNFTRDDSLGRVERGAARLSLAWQPAARIDTRMNFNGWIDHSDTQATQITAFRAQVPANAELVPDVFASPVPPSQARAANWNPARNYARNDAFHQLSLKTTYTVDTQVKLISTTAWSVYDTHSFNDRDGMAPADFEFAANGHIDSAYQELRVAGDGPALAWNLGGNFRRDHTREVQATDVSRSTNTFIAGLKLNYVDLRATQAITSWAFFGDVELRIAPRLAAIAGVRYTRDERDFSGSTCDTGDGGTSAVFTALANAFRDDRGLPELPPIPPGECVTLSADTLEPGVVRGRLAEDNVAFRGQLDIRPLPDTLLYASYSRGFKAGSFSTLSAVFAPVYGPATQERVDAVEAGFNSAHFNQRLRLRAAAFRYDYRNKQFRGRVQDPVIGSIPKLVNIPRAVIRGVEMDVAASPMPGLSLRAAAAYLHTEVKAFQGVNLFGQPEDFAGQTLPYTPPWSVNFTADYQWPLRGTARAFAGADAAWRSRTSGFLGRDRAVDIEAFATLDLRVGVGWHGDRWQLSGWVNNATNHYYVTSAMRAGDTLTAYAARPRTWGIAMRFSH